MSDGVERVRRALAPFLSGFREDILSFNDMELKKIKFLLMRARLGIKQELDTREEPVVEFEEWLEAQGFTLPAITNLDAGMREDLELYRNGELDLYTLLTNIAKGYWDGA